MVPYLAATLHTPLKAHPTGRPKRLATKAFRTRGRPLFHPSANHTPRATNPNLNQNLPIRSAPKSRHRRIQNAAITPFVLHQNPTTQRAVRTLICRFGQPARCALRRRRTSPHRSPDRRTSPRRRRVQIRSGRAPVVRQRARRSAPSQPIRSRPGPPHRAYEPLPPRTPLLIRGCQPRRTLRGLPFNPIHGRPNYQDPRRAYRIFQRRRNTNRSEHHRHPGHHGQRHHQRVPTSVPSPSPHVDYQRTVKLLTRPGRPIPAAPNPARPV